MDCTARKELHMMIRISPADKRRLQAAAHQRGKTLSAFMREAAAEAAFSYSGS